MIEFLFIKYLDRKIINGIMVKSVDLDYMERCPSGLRCMIGNHVAGEYRHGGSNPPLSAIKTDTIGDFTDGIFSC